MAIGIDAIQWIATTVGIAIQAARLHGAFRVRSVKTHQDRIVKAVSCSQCIGCQRRLSEFAIEAQMTADNLLGGRNTIEVISNMADRSLNPSRRYIAPLADEKRQRDSTVPVRFTTGVDVAHGGTSLRR
ncbi:hypothetical protein AYO28_23395 [Pseudomonas putida]|uniref:Uncharacterized protein n=1 Tax=Pseudomonas putida TaxID=303 RepID=A0A177SJD4_PSEPU|nr:hypothetical protein AYO28_23395 [Pseudomonas putida]